MANSLSIVIPNFNGERLIPKFLPGVIAAARKIPWDWEILVIDDGSTDKSIEMLESFSDIRVVRRETNGGFSAACNTGLAEAKYEKLFFLNTDVDLPLHFFDRYSEYFTDPNTFAVTVKGCQYATSKWIDGAKLCDWRRGFLRVTYNYYEDEIKVLSAQNVETAQHAKGLLPSFSVQGAYFFTTKARMQELKGFDELFNPYLFEETDLAYRALKRGWKIYYDPMAVAYHELSSTLNSVAKKRKLKMLGTRNRTFFVIKNIQDSRYLCSFLFHYGARLLFLNICYWKAFLEVFERRKELLQKRNFEKKAVRVRDRELLMKFNVKNWKKCAIQKGSNG